MFLLDIFESTASGLLGSGLDNLTSGVGAYVDKTLTGGTETVRNAWGVVAGVGVAGIAGVVGVGKGMISRVKKTSDNITTNATDRFKALKTSTDDSIKTFAAIQDDSEISRLKWIILESQTKLQNSFISDDLKQEYFKLMNEAHTELKEKHGIIMTVPSSIV